MTKNEQEKSKQTQSEKDGKCRSCGGQSARLAPCPYAQEINGDDRPVWLCADCRHERAMDI